MIHRNSFPLQETKYFHTFKIENKFSPKTTNTEFALASNEAIMSHLEINTEQKKRISELESQLIYTQAELLESNKTIDKLKRDVKRQRSKRTSLLRTKTTEIKETEISHQIQLNNMRQEYLEFKESKNEHINNLQKELDRMYKIIASLQDENDFLRHQKEATPEVNRCLKPQNYSFNETNLDHSQENERISKRKDSKNHRKKLNLGEVKRWIGSEISKLWLSDTDEIEQLDMWVTETHPLYPIIEMMKSLTSKSFDKQKKIHELESHNAKLKSELDSLEVKTPHVIK